MYPVDLDTNVVFLLHARGFDKKLIELAGLKRQLFGKMPYNTYANHR